MPNLISSGLLFNLEASRDDVFDSFAINIVVFRTPIKTIINSDVNYSFSYESPDYQGSDDYVNYTPVSGVIPANILYDKKLDRIFSNSMNQSSEDFGLILDQGLVRIKIKKTDYDIYMQGVIDYQLDGNHFSLYQTPRPHGVLSPKYYSLYLKFKN